MEICHQVPLWDTGLGLTADNRPNSDCTYEPKTQTRQRDASGWSEFNSHSSGIIEVGMATKNAGFLIQGALHPLSLKGGTGFSRAFSFGQSSVRVHNHVPE